MAPRLARVYDIGTLQRGQQIAWKRQEKLATFYHHAIVESVDADIGTVNCIERSTGGVTRFVHDEHDEMYSVIHSTQKPYDEVYSRARSRNNEEGYHLKDNNCEHFANWCSTGEDRSYQAEERRFGCALCVYIQQKKTNKTSN